MRLLPILLGIALLMSMVGAVRIIDPLPSDSISYHGAPTAISLQNVDRESAYAIDDMHTPLGAFVPQVLPNIGHYFSENVTIVQTDYVGVPTALLNFSNAKVELTPSIGVENETEKGGY